MSTSKHKENWRPHSRSLHSLSWWEDTKERLALKGHISLSINKCCPLSHLPFLLTPLVSPYHILTLQSCLLSNTFLWITCFVCCSSHCEKGQCQCCHCSQIPNHFCIGTLCCSLTSLPWMSVLFMSPVKCWNILLPTHSTGSLTSLFISSLYFKHHFDVGYKRYIGAHNFCK